MRVLKLVIECALAVLAFALVIGMIALVAPR